MARKCKKNHLGSQYIVLFQIGEGAFGTVNLACYRKTQAVVTIKTVETIEKLLGRILSEIVILETLHHLNISHFQVLITSQQVHVVSVLQNGTPLN